MFVETNKSNKKKPVHTENRVVVPRGEGAAGRVKRVNWVGTDEN